MIEFLVFALHLALFLPLGINLAVSTVVESIILAMVLVYRVRLGAYMRPEVIVFVLIAAVNVAISYWNAPEYAFQIVRSAIGPIAFVLIATRLSDPHAPPLPLTPSQTRIVVWALVSVAVIALINPEGALPQNLSILVEADALSSERKFLIPHTAFNVLFPLFVLTRRWLPAAACLVVILAAGSRGALVAATLTVIVFLLLEKSRAILPLLGVAGVFTVIGLLFPAAFERLGSQSFFEEYTRMDELAAATKAAFAPATVLTGLPFTFPYWNGYEGAGGLPGDQRVVVNTMFDVHNGFIFVVLRFGLVGATCLAIALLKLWRARPELRSVLVSFLLLWLTSAGPISSVDGAFAIALAAAIVLVGRHVQYAPVTARQSLA
jgi:hypothetical protein